MMLAVVVVASLMGMTSAIVCTPQLCAEMTQPLLDCQGGIIKGGGFCHCTDACAKLEGEACQAEIVHGIIPIGTCDLDLHCQKLDNMAFGRGICVKTATDVDLGVIHKRQTTAHTKCEQMRLTAMITMVVWAGKWTARCDAEGNFLPEQCDMSGHCFCVTQEGTVVEGTKVLGAADCSNVDPTAQATTAQLLLSRRQLTLQTARTKCEHQRIASLMSMVVWSGKWTPTCDADGNYTPHQCLFSGACFCVTADGDKSEGSDGAGVTECGNTDVITTTPAPVGVISKRQMPSQTLCQRRRIASMISQIYYEGMWFPKCDDAGSFLPQQCDNTGHCFCVNTETGVILEGTKVLGDAHCSSDSNVNISN